MNAYKNAGLHTKAGIFQSGETCLPRLMFNFPCTLRAGYSVPLLIQTSAQ